MDFKSNSAYKKWLAFGHASGKFASTPGHQPVSIKGKAKTVEHKNGSTLASNIPIWNYPSAGTPIFRNTSEIPPNFKYGGIMFNDGGQMGMPVTEFGDGGTHEENPLGGIPQGIGANGQPNLVEEGELKVKDPTTGQDFIITNNDKMVMTKEIANKYGIPSKFVGKKLNKIGRDILRLDSKRIGDSIEETSKNRELANFIEAHKELTEMQNAKDAQEREAKFLKEITELQEEYPEYMQALMSQGQPEMQGPSPEEQAMMEQQMMMEQQGMGMPQMGMTYGGTMYDFGGVMRGIGSGLQALSGVASAIPGVGTIVGGAANALGAGLQNVGTGANIGEVIADAGLGALAGAVPGVGGMVAGMAQGLVPNSPVQYGNGGPNNPPTEEPEYRTKQYKYGAKEVSFYELPETQQRFLDYKYGWRGYTNPETGERVYQGVENPGWNFAESKTREEMMERLKTLGDYQQSTMDESYNHQMAWFTDPETGTKWRLPSSYLGKYQPMITGEQNIKPQGNIKRNGGGTPTEYPEDIQKLLTRRRDLLNQSPYASQRGNKESFDVWKGDLRKTEDALIKRSKELGITIPTEHLNTPPNYVPEEYRSSGFGITPVGNIVSKTFRNGANMYDNGNPFSTAIGGINSFLGSGNQLSPEAMMGYFSQNPSNDSSNTKEGSENSIPAVTYKEGLEGLLTLAAPAYNIYQGLQKPEFMQEDRYYEGVSAPQIDYSEANKQSRRMFSGVQKGLRGAGSPGAYMANLVNSSNAMNQQFAQNTQAQENQQAGMDYQAAVRNAGMKAGSKQQADAINAQMEQMRQAQLAAGFTGIGQIGRDIEANKMGLAYANMMAPDFQIEYSNLMNRFLNNPNKKNN